MNKLFVLLIVICLALGILSFIGEGLCPQPARGLGGGTERRAH